MSNPVYVGGTNLRTCAEQAILASIETGRQAVVRRDNKVVFRCYPDTSWSGIYNELMKPTTGGSAYLWEIIQYEITLF